MTDSWTGDSSSKSLCFEERISAFLVRLADFVNMCVNSPCCNSWFCSAMLTPLLMQILTSEGVRIPIIHSSPLSKTQWRSFFILSYKEMCFHIATKHSELFLCWNPTDFLQNRSYWECSSLAVFQYTIQFFLFQCCGINCITIFVVTRFACVLEGTRIPPFAQFGICTVTILGFVLWPFWWVPKIACRLLLALRLLKMVAYRLIWPYSRAGTFRFFFYTWRWESIVQAGGWNVAKRGGRGWNKKEV